MQEFENNTTDALFSVAERLAPKLLDLLKNPPVTDNERRSASLSAIMFRKIVAELQRREAAGDPLCDR